ncbi:hypothetical protein H6F43_13230 [Leptolyngbya sp. FACHB-36]|uniref:hypothetical protein n=1 Tax=Leptolyngbya sp. FACHB-36 TaxID=2692808 RepID=UPI001680C880|nr:hypothetical protein [Leptolyngbya sp. FACHB-36]MBD2021142.1 hypothetical protein [Leptolyngbya sp. FACHB-36]
MSANFNFSFPTIPTFDSLTGLFADSSVAGSTIDITSTIGYNKTIATGINNDYIRAGLGSDIIGGGAGADIFAFGSPLEGIDTIADFAIEQGDKIEISGVGFGIGVTELNRFSYYAATGGLYFDNIQLATLPINLNFSPANLTIV